MNKGYVKFISKQRDDGEPMFYDAGPQVMVEHTVMTDEATRDELLEQFKLFLIAIGYHFDSDDYLAVQNDEQNEQPYYDDSCEDLNNHVGNLNRVEVIDDTGRAYTNYDVGSANLQLQDNNETLKIFLASLPCEVER